MGVTRQFDERAATASHPFGSQNLRFVDIASLEGGAQRLERVKEILHESRSTPPDQTTSFAPRTSSARN